MYNYYDYKSMFDPSEILMYLRKSRSDDPLLSVEEVLQKHETILDAWTEQNLGARICEENRFREIISGETIADRPEVQKLLKKSESPKYRAILCVEVQRLSRGDLEDAGRLIKLLRFSHTFVITPQKTYNLEDEYDRDAFERELKRGNEFLEYQKKIMNRGRLLSVSQGNYIGSVPPYGYDKTWIMDGKRKCPTLRENKEQADVVRTIFDLYVNKDMGYPKICNHLESLHISPPKGKYWSQAALRDLLQNVHYIGKVKWNWRKTITIVEDSEIIQTRPKSQIGEYLVYDGKHEGIVSDDIFNLAQEKMGRNHRAKPGTKVRNVLASLLYCRCGKAMILRTNVKNGVEKNAPRLTCGDQKHCHTGSCLYDEMIERVSVILKQCIEDFEIRLKNDTGDSIKLHNQLIKNLEKKLKDLEAKELSQWEAQSDPNPDVRMPPAIFKQLNEKILKEKEEIRQALDTARDSMPESIDYAERVDRFREALNALKNPKVDEQEKNRLLKACIDRIEYHRDTPQVIKKKPGEKKGTYTVGGHWTSPPIEIDVKLKV